MKQELVRMKSLDDIELVGILYTPNVKSQKIAIYVHGLSGNFYENRFLDNLAEVYTNKGYSLLTFNNRGKDYASEMLKGNEYVILGSCYELFKDCVLDIDGVIEWVKSKDYTDITLIGHSYGCNKVIYYYEKKKSDNVKNIVLLGPCDIPTEIENYTSDRYKDCIKESKKLIEYGKESEFIDFPVFPNGKISAKTFYTDFLYESECDFFRYREKNTKSKILNNIDVPVLIIFGDEDECVLTESKETVIEYLKSNIKECKIEIIRHANHSYDNKYEELEEKIRENI